MKFSLDELRVYARCGLEWFWEKRVGIEKPQTIQELLPEALRTALAFYYGGHAESLGAAVGLVWRDWCEGWGDSALASDLVQYARGRAGILKQFEEGRVTRPDGRRYTVPQMTNEYRMRMHSTGMTHLGRTLDEFARTHGLLAADDSDKADRPGSALGDVFADCMAAAEQVTELPAREIVLGWQVPYAVDLGNGIYLLGAADLVTQALPEAGEGAVILEVHDFQKLSWLTAGWAGRDLRVIAASLARSTPESLGRTTQPLTWTRVDRVIYRNWPDSRSFTFRETNVGHLLAVVAAAARGMLSQVVIPRALTGYDGCRSCAYRTRCWSEGGWEVLPLIDPTELGQAEQLRTMQRKVREAIAGNDQAAQHARQAIEIIEAELQFQHPDLLGLKAMLSEAKHTLEAVSHD